jgi:hypothetical protein
MVNEKELKKKARKYLKDKVQNDKDQKIRDLLDKAQHDSEKKANGETKEES